MKLNHLNLTVDDALVAGTFLATHFGLTPKDGMKMSSKFAMLSDENGMVLTLFQNPMEGPVLCPTSFHIGFIQESHERVNSIHQQLVEARIDAPAPSRIHGSWTFYFTAPGGFTIEVLG